MRIGATKLGGIVDRDSFAEITIAIQPVGGVCAEVDPEIFFPDGRGANEASTAAAKAICADCPVRRECAQVFIDAHEAEREKGRGGRIMFGIWAGVNVPYFSAARRAAIRQLYEVAGRECPDDDAIYRCGHERTDDNTVIERGKRGQDVPRCRRCRRRQKIDSDARRRRRANHAA